jgi:alpha/beta superfamily hydrolase
MSTRGLAMSVPPFPDRDGTLLLPGPAGAIELACALPEAGIARAGVAIVCHPHPLQGGTMHNKVVTIVERALLELGLAVVRFNFRGIGKSEGEHDNGIGETEDLVAIAAWLRKVGPGDVLWLGGFSFGGYVALRATARLQPAQLILVAPPVGRWDFAEFAAPTCPWLIVQGEDDEVVDPKAVFAWAESVKPAPHLVRMPETGHFFHRRLMDLRGVLKNALGANLPPVRAGGA